MRTMLGRHLGKVALSAALAAIGSSSLAGDWTGWAVPVHVDVVRSEGFMVYGSFGNPAGCTVANQFFVAINHPQYNQIYAAVISAIATGRQVMAYSDSCNAVTWYSIASVTYNTVSSGSALSIQ